MWNYKPIAKTSGEETKGMIHKPYEKENTADSTLCQTTVLGIHIMTMKKAL